MPSNHSLATRGDTSGQYWCDEANEARRSNTVIEFEIEVLDGGVEEFVFTFG
jgi:hypothetical protein